MSELEVMKSEPSKVVQGLKATGGCLSDTADGKSN